MTTKKTTTKKPADSSKPASAPASATITLTEPVQAWLDTIEQHLLKTQRHREEIPNVELLRFALCETAGCIQREANGAAERIPDSALAA